MPCDGPNGSKWFGDGCIATAAQTSCSESTGETCFYAFLDFFVSPPRIKSSVGLQPEPKAEWFACKIREGKVVISNPGPLALRRIKAGDVIDLGCGTTEKALEKHLSKYTPEKPARIANVVLHSEGILVTLAWK